MSVNPAALNGLSEYLSSCKMAMPHMSDSLAHIQKLILATQTEALPSRDAFDAIRNHLMDWSDRDEANKIAMMAGEALGIKWRGKRSEEAISSTVPEKKARGEDPVRKEDAVKMTVKSFHGKARGRAVFRARLSQQMLVEEPVGRLDFLTPARWKSADSDPKEIASILQNEKMVVGIRRNLMIESIRDPKAAEETKKYIERQAADQLTRAGVSQEEVISTVRAMVGDAPLVLRQCGPHPLSSTEELLSDIDFLLDAASKTRSSADAIRLIREVSYSVPELLLTDQADERIQKAMIVLVNNGVPPRERIL